MVEELASTIAYGTDGTAILAIAGLVLLSHIANRLWRYAVAPSIFFREEMALQKQIGEVQTEINSVEVSELAKRGRLERKELSLKKRLDALQRRRWRHSLSLASLILNQEEFSDANPIQPHSLLSSISLFAVNAPRRIALIAYFNCSCIISLCIYALPSTVYVVSTGCSRPITHFPGLRQLGDESSTIPCPAWVWTVMCYMAIRLTFSVWLDN